jgi:hypothetical protein
MQREKARAPVRAVVGEAVVEEARLATLDGPPPPQPAASRARPASVGMNTAPRKTPARQFIPSGKQQTLKWL